MPSSNLSSAVIELWLLVADARALKGDTAGANRALRNAATIPDGDRKATGAAPKHWYSA